MLFSTSETRNCENAKNGKLEAKHFFHFMRDFDAVLNLRVYLTIAFRISSDKTYYMVLSDVSLREKCPNAEFFWSIISCIWTEYGELLSKFPYLVRILENAGQKKLFIWTRFTQYVLDVLREKPFFRYPCYHMNLISRYRPKEC